MQEQVHWPDGKRFAFTVFDDTDHTTMQNGPQVYQLLYDLGMLTTKSVWPVKGEQVPRVGGATCADADYLAWVRELQRQGFEIALHNASYHALKREQILAALDQFKTFFGSYPKVHTNHVDCEDGLYWGDARMTGVNKVLYNLFTRLKNRGTFLGDVQSSEFFWGDQCKQHIKYVRNFVYADINTLKACPCMPYFDEDRPLVNYWFASSEGANCRSFCRRILERNQDRLEREGGCCIMFTHFGSPDFYQDGRVNAEFKRLIERLSAKNGWFAPVSTVLDHIQTQRGACTISARERTRLERKWLIEKVLITRGST